MPMIPRRGLLAGLGALLAAPAIIRTPGLLMPVKPPPLVMGVDGMDWCGQLAIMAPTGGVLFKARYDRALSEDEVAAIYNHVGTRLRIGGKG